MCMHTHTPIYMVSYFRKHKSSVKDLLLCSDMIHVLCFQALGDLCIAPDAFLEREVVTTPKADILSYYIRCDQSRSNPFFQRLLQGQQAVKAMSSNLVTVARIAKELYKPVELHPKLDVLTTDISQVDNLASGLSTLLDCKSLHRQYLNATRSVCDLGL